MHHQRLRNRGRRAGVYTVMRPLPPLPAAADRWAFFLDVDGTLVEIATTPQAVRLEPDLPLLLPRLARLAEGALALVSGRSLADIDLLFDPLRLPVAGLHGWQRRRADGTLVAAPEPKAALDRMRPLLAAFAAARPGLLFEDKGGSLALHYRLAPRYGGATLALGRRITEAEPELRLIAGRKVAELVPRGMDKGRAIAAFLEEPPFAGRRPVYAGDDTTDEDAFRLVEERGGIAIQIAGSENRARRRSIARYALPGVRSLHRWLAAAGERLERSEKAGDASEAERARSLAC